MGKFDNNCYFPDFFLFYTIIAQAAYSVFITLKSFVLLIIISISITGFA